MKTKKCTKCGIEKPLSEFSKDNHKKSDHTSQCKVCKNNYMKLFRKNNIELCKIYLKRSTLKRTFGLSLDDYNDMLINQNYRCAICNKKETRKINGKICKLSVDHNHKTGKVRGLLCNDCNNGIGRLKENISILKTAIDYLRSYDGQKNKRS